MSIETILFIKNIFYIVCEINKKNFYFLIVYLDSQIIYLINLNIGI